MGFVAEEEPTNLKGAAGGTLADPVEVLSSQEEDVAVHGRRCTGSEAGEGD